MDAGGLLKQAASYAKPMPLVYIFQLILKMRIQANAMWVKCKTGIHVTSSCKDLMFVDVLRLICLAH